MQKENRFSALVFILWVVLQTVHICCLQLAMSDETLEEASWKEMDR